MSWMQTYTGAAFHPGSPSPDEIRIDDIAASLSKQCRYAGHCIKFYSVAEHCVHVCRAAPNHMKLAGLMHDASEAYLVDVPRPVKPMITGYAALEDHLMSMIATKFGFAWPVPPEIKDLDNRILLDERDQNMARPPKDWGIPGDPLGVTLRFWTPAEAAYQFLTEYYRYV